VSSGAHHLDTFTCPSKRVALKRSIAAPHNLMLSCRRLAVKLARHDVPFIMYSGLQQRKCADPASKQEAWMEKPVAFGPLLNAFADAQRMLLRQCR
jgi:hypothetical protein